MKKKTIIVVFVIIQICGAYYATVQGEKNKQAQINHQKVVNQYYNSLKNN